MALADRVLATVLVVKLVSPALLAARFGDRNWKGKLDQLREAANLAFSLYHGHLGAIGAEEITGHFDGPARAVRCALALRDAAHALSLDLAAGIHTGEIEIQDNSFAGLTVHVAERICDKAGAAEILVSGVVADLVAGSGLHFAEQARETIDELHGPLRVLAVRVEQHLEPHAPAQGTRTLDALSTREREVLTLVADGLSNGAIAKRLHLSDHTVKRHVANILLKLDLPTRAAAAALIGRPAANRGL